MSAVAGKSVTINLSANNYGKPLFNEGQKVNVSKEAWWLPKQRIKNRMMVHRLLKKKYHFPFFRITKVANGIDETTLTLKPINF